MAASSSKMLLSWMAFWNMAVRRTMRWSGGGWGPAVGWLDEMLVEAMVEAMVETLIEGMCNAPMRRTMVFTTLFDGFRFCQSFKIFILFSLRRR